MKERDFELLCQAMLEGTCTEEEFRALEEMLSASPRKRQIFRENFLMHAMLSIEADSVGPAEVVGKPVIIAPQRRFLIRPGAMVAAAAVVLLAVLALKVADVVRTPTLRITAGPKSKYTVTGNAKASDSLDKLEPGASVVLSEGTLELQFANGVKSIVQAPASFRIQSPEMLNMDIGIARFEVPERAKGFTVITPRLEVVDLGTSFGVVEQPDEPAQTHVFAGQVTAKARMEEKATLLNAGAAVEDAGQGRLVQVPLDDSLFFKTLPWDLPFVHLSFEPDASGEIFLEGCHPSLESFVATVHPDGPGLTNKGAIGSAALFRGRATPVVTNWKGVGGAVPRTICAWVRQEPGLPPRRFQTIVSWGDPTIGLAAKCEMLLYQPETANRSVLRLSFDQYLFTGTTELADGRWHHLAAVCHTDPTGQNAPRVELYVDGRRESIDPRESVTNPRIPQRPNTRVGQKNSMPLVIGYTDRPDPGRGFRGAIDEVYVFEACLPQQRIIELATPPMAPN